MISVMHKKRTIQLIIVFLFFSFSSIWAQHADGPTGVWESDYGPMDFSPANAGYFATFEEGDYPGGRLIGQLNGRIFDGIWVENADSGCEEPRDGDKYWGRVRLEFNESFTTFEGTWSYCDGNLGCCWSGLEPVVEGET